MRRIKDEELLEILQQGKSQKEAAEHFGVSPVAICKRLKRLLPQPSELLARHKLTAQQERFVIEKARGKTNTQAAMSSYEVSSMESAKVVGSQLMARPEIQMAIADLMEHKGIGREYRITRLGQHMEHPDPVVSLKALDMGFKLEGSYTQDREADRFPTSITLNVVVGSTDGQTSIIEVNPRINQIEDEK